MAEPRVIQALSCRTHTSISLAFGINHGLLFNLKSRRSQTAGRLDQMSCDAPARGRNVNHFTHLDISVCCPGRNYLGDSGCIFLDSSPSKIGHNIYVLRVGTCNRQYANSVFCDKSGKSNTLYYYIEGFYIIFRTLDVKVDVENVSDHTSAAGLISSILSSLGLIFQTLLFTSIFWFSTLMILNHFGIINILFFDRLEAQVWNYVANSWSR